MKKLIFLPLLCIPFLLGAQNLTLSAAQVTQIKNISYGDNLKILSARSIAPITDTLKLSVTSLRLFKTIDVQVDWSALTGTLDGKIIIQQRGESTMQWTCVQPTEADPGNMVKTLSTAAGSYTITLWAWNANDLRIVFVKGNCTGGVINVSLGLRR